MQAAAFLTPVDSFDPVGLEEMEHVKLMNRAETKYVLPLNRLPGFLCQLSGSYRMLEIGGERVMQYHNIYLDTCDYFFFNQHLTGKLDRNKVRYRRYENTGVTYLEVKKKTNRNRVVKFRIECNKGENYCSSKDIAFINDHLPQNSLKLDPVLKNQFNRITLAGKRFNERVTIDFDMSYLDFSGKSIKFPYLSIIEIKRKEQHAVSVLGELLKRNYVHPGGFSKYCLGNAVINNPLRQNVLKPKFLMLKKLENEFTRSLLS